MALSSEEAKEILTAQTHIWNHGFKYIQSMSLKCAIQLGIPDVMHKHGQPMTLSHLVDALSINKAKSQDCIYRLMRILTHANFFIQTKINENEEEAYLLSPSSRLLLKDDPFIMIPFLEFLLDQIVRYPSDCLSKWLENADTTPFETAYGKTFFEYTKNESKINHMFNEAMASDSRLVISVLIQHYKGVFEGLKSLVDVGGGTGIVAKAIAEAFPEIKCNIFYIPHVIEGLERSKNLSYVGGDMFQSIPCANAILLKWILHDWNNEECIQILKKCKEAIPTKENGGKVIIIDMVVDNQKLDHKSYETQLFFDMTMMVHFLGKERSQKDWERLFNEAGFSEYKIIPILGLRSVIEVYP